MKKFTIEIKWGIIFFVVTLIWVFFEKIMGWHDELISKHAMYTNFFGIIAIGIYLLALYDKRKNFFKGKMSWQQGFISGIVLTIVITLLSPLAQYITSTIITPDYFNNMISYSVENGRMSRENAEAYFNLESYVIQAIFGALAVGVVTAAIVALILRKK